MVRIAQWQWAHLSIQPYFFQVIQAHSAQGKLAVSLLHKMAMVPLSTRKSFPLTCPHSADVAPPSVYEVTPVRKPFRDTCQAQAFLDPSINQGSSHGQTEVTPGIFRPDLVVAAFVTTPSSLARSPRSLGPQALPLFPLAFSSALWAPIPTFKSGERSRQIDNFIQL